MNLRVERSTAPDEDRARFSRLERLATRALALGGLAALLDSSYLMASQPWRWCNATGGRCDDIATTGWAGLWLAFGIGVSLFAWKKRTTPLLIVAGFLLILDAIGPLRFGIFPSSGMTFGVLSYIASFTAAPAALWLASGIWQLVDGRRPRLVVAALASVVLVAMAVLSASHLATYHTGTLKASVPYGMVML